MKKFVSLTSKIATSLPVGRHYFDDVPDLSLLGEDNYRKIDTESDDFASLRTSILISGIRETPVLWKALDSEKIYIVAGHKRRLAVASLRARGDEHYVKYPAILEVGENSGIIGAKVASVVTNIMKSNLTVLERARAVNRLLESGMPVREIAGVIGLDERSVRRTLSVLRLPERVVGLIEKAPAGAVKDRDVYRLASRAGKTTEEEIERELTALLESPPQAMESRKGKSRAKETAPEGPLYEWREVRESLRLVGLSPSTIEKVQRSLRMTASLGAKG